MTRTDAVHLLAQYATVTDDPIARDLLLRSKLSSDVTTPILWLGFLQGLYVAWGRYSSIEVAAHRQQKRVPTVAEEMTREHGGRCPNCGDDTVFALDCADSRRGSYEICLGETCEYYKREEPLDG